jgi:hypothetical protein
VPEKIQTLAGVADSLDTGIIERPRAKTPAEVDPFRENDRDVLPAPDEFPAEEEDVPDGILCPPRAVGGVLSTPPDAEAGDETEIRERAEIRAVGGDDGRSGFRSVPE